MPAARSASGSSRTLSILDPSERGFGQGPLQVAPHQQEQIALGRDHQVALLDGPGEVVQVHVLQDDGGIDTVAAKPCLNGDGAPVKLSGWEHVHRAFFSQNGYLANHARDRTPPPRPRGCRPGHALQERPSGPGPPATR